MLFADVGANSGFFGLYVRSLGFQVEMFDAQRGQVALQRLSAAYNGWVDNIKMHHTALCNTSGSMVHLMARASTKLEGHGGRNFGGTLVLEASSESAEELRNGAVPEDGPAVQCRMV